MKQERIDELLKAAKERINGPPGSRGITLLPEEVLELLETGLQVEAPQAAAGAPLAPYPQAKTVATSGQWDAVGRIAAAYISKQPPGLSALKVVTYTAEIIAQIESRFIDG